MRLQKFSRKRNNRRSRRRNNRKTLIKHRKLKKHSRRRRGGDLSDAEKEQRFQNLLHNKWLTVEKQEELTSKGHTIKNLLEANNYAINDTIKAINKIIPPKPPSEPRYGYYGAQDIVIDEHDKAMSRPYKTEWWRRVQHNL